MSPIVYYIRDIAACFVAVIFYGIFMSVPKKPLFLAAGSGTAAYLLYRLILLEAGSELFGYLAASLLAAVAAEVLARCFKTPSTILVFPAIIPLVPGVGLYRTMLCLVQNDMENFSHVFSRALLISGIIAVTVAVVNAAARSLFHPHVKKNCR